MSGRADTLHELRRQLDADETSSVALVEAALSRAESAQARWNGFMGFRADRARA